MRKIQPLNIFQNIFLGTGKVFLPNSKSKFSQSSFRKDPRDTLSRNFSEIIFSDICLQDPPNVFTTPYNHANVPLRSTYASIILCWFLGFGTAETCAPNPEVWDFKLYPVVQSVVQSFSSQPFFTPTYIN